MLLDALRYPIAGERRLESLLIGGALHALTVFLSVLPLIPVAGYLVRVLRHVASDESPGAREAIDEGPPDWRPVVPLIWEGVTAIGVAAIYLLVPFVLLVRNVADAGGAAPAAPGGLVGASPALVLVVTVAFASPLPAALAAYASDGLGAAFDPGRLSRALRDPEYLVATVTVLALLVVAGGLYVPLNRVALGYFFAFYVELVVATVVARAAT